MPISRAASGSWAVARMALPRRLRPTKLVSRNTSGMVTTTARMLPRVICTPKMSMTSFWLSIRSGVATWEAPIHSTPTFCRMKDIPTAVISAASFGAFLSGR